MPTGQEIHDKKIKERQIKRDASSSSTVRKRLGREISNLQQKPDYQRIGIDAKGGTKGRVAVDTGKQAHHRTSLNNASAFFEGLDLPEKHIMGWKFAQYGLTPGDLTMNRLDMFAELHQGGIHKIERSLGLEGKQYFKPGASLKEKLLAVEEFAADQKLLASLADRMQFSAEFQTSGLTKRVESTATSELAAEYSEKGARRLKGQKADFLEYIPEQHEIATALGPQMASKNDARLTALEPYFNSEGAFDAKRLDADVKAGNFILPKASAAVPVPRTPLKFNKGVAKFIPGISVVAGLSAIGERARAGDFEGAAGEAVATVVGEVPIVGDIAVTEAEGRAAGEGSVIPQGITPQQYTQMQIEQAKTAKTFEQKVANELSWAAKNPAKAVKNVAEAGLSTALSSGLAALDNPMLMPYTSPLKAIGGAMKLFGL
jgi:hypothetical protein